MWFVTRSRAAGCRLDSESTEQAQYLDIDPDTRMPVKAGEITVVPGKNFEIVKLDEKPVDEELRAVIRRLCGGMADALNKVRTARVGWAELQSA